MRHVTLDANGGVILHLQVPTSARRAHAAFGAWHAAQAAYRDAILVKDPDAAQVAACSEAGDLGACAAVLHMASPDPACPPLQAYANGDYARAQTPGGPEPVMAAAADLLAWMEDRGCYLADVGEALKKARDLISQPTSALVEEARGN